MSILLGILIYFLCVLFFCALTRANGADEPDALTKPRRADERFEAEPARVVVRAPEAHG
jgi:hypothetical protein